MCMTYADNTELEVRSWPDYSNGTVSAITLRGKGGEKFGDKLVSLTHDDVIALLKKFNGKADHTTSDYTPLNPNEYTRRQKDDEEFDRLIFGSSRKREPSFA